MDAASSRAAAIAAEKAAKKARYDARARAAALQYGTATFPIKNYDELKDARNSMKNHPRGTVQQVYIIRDNLNQRAVDRLTEQAKEMGDQEGYYVIMLAIHPDP